MNMSKLKTSVTGFTLIELLIVIAILGLLLSIAIPAYTSQVQTTRRGQAKADLLEYAQAMERFYTANNTYVGYTIATPQSPRQGDAIYTLATPTLTATTYVLQATPLGGQAGDNCGVLTVNQAGVRTAAGPRTAADCWR